MSPRLKGGLFGLLSQHPEIQISASMEPKFVGRNYRCSWEWYGQQFSGGEHCRLRGETSTMYTSSYHSYQHTPQLIRHHLGIIPLIYLVRHPLRRIQSQWRHWRGRINDCPPFNQLLESKVLKQRVVEESLYHKQLMRYRQSFPAKSIHYLSTEELTTHPIKSLNTILKFLSQHANGSALLFKGSLPLTNPAGSKRRRDIEPPQWKAELKKRTIEIIQPDGEAFLKIVNWPTTRSNGTNTTFKSIQLNCKPQKTIHNLNGTPQHQREKLMRIFVLHQ